MPGKNTITKYVYDIKYDVHGYIIAHYMVKMRHRLLLIKLWSYEYMQSLVVWIVQYDMGQVTELTVAVLLPGFAINW